MTILIILCFFMYAVGTYQFVSEDKPLLIREWVIILLWPITGTFIIIHDAISKLNTWWKNRKNTGVLDKHGEMIRRGDIVNIQEDYGFTGYDGWPKGPITSGTINRKDGKFVLNTGKYTLSDWDQFDDIWIENKKLK